LLPPVLQNLRLPVIGAPLFLISDPRLVIAQCRAGIVGSFPALNARPKEQLADWLAQITEAPGKLAPFAVNQIVHKSNDRLEHDLELCIRFRAPIVISSLGARPEVYQAVHSYGGVVFTDVSHTLHARKAVEKGSDGLIALAAGAGGHTGTWSPFALVEEIREWFDGPLALAGAIATGRSIRAAIGMGADLAYIGSPFIATEEANAAAKYKQMIVEASAADIVCTDSFSGLPANYLRASIVANGFDPENLRRRGGAMDIQTEAEGDGPRAWRDIWGAGQGVGAVKAVKPVEELVRSWLY
jgi:nitronate monooxygenase